MHTLRLLLHYPSDFFLSQNFSSLWICKLGVTLNLKSFLNGPLPLAVVQTGCAIFKIEDIPQSASTKPQLWPLNFLLRKHPLEGPIETSDSSTYVLVSDLRK
jgi:hypothetical protein